jgi:hypothetical protein
MKTCILQKLQNAIKLGVTGVTGVTGIKKRCVFKAFSVVWNVTPNVTPKN